jgi:DNA recombination protein RmuC
MIEALVAVVALLAGGALGWVLSGARAAARTAAAEARETEVRRELESARAQAESLRSRTAESENARVTAETRAHETEKNLSEQKALLEDARQKLTETFRSAAAEALAGSNQGFLLLAEEKLQGLVRPLNETLTNYQKEARSLEEKRLQEVGLVGQQLTTLQNETAKLVNALRSPQVRGRWGEIALRRTAELAGMSLHCDFVEQHTLFSEEGSVRPDMIVRLPAGREVVVDSKVPLEGFLQALEATTEPEREAALQRHASQIQQHVTKLAAKDYWDQLSSTPEFVVLFIPNDSFLAAAAEKAPDLIESAIAKKVIIATPATFIALLRAIAYGWRQEALAENAERISQLGQELYDRLATLAEHFSKLGGSIGKAVEAYNLAVGALESRVFPSARRFKELGAGTKKEVEELPLVNQRVRPLAPPEASEEE